MEIPVVRLGEMIGGEIKGDAGKVICGVAPFEDAENNDITLAGNPKFLKRLNETGAGAVIVPLDCKTDLKTIIRVKNPQVAFAKVLKYFHHPSKPKAGISPKACIGENFLCGNKVSVAPFVVIGDNVSFGNYVEISAGAVICDKVSLGDNVKIYPNVTVLEGCKIGSRVIIHAGTVIGADGFGFAPDGKKYVKIPHTGIVQIDDDVEIGANNTIDRATFGRTWIQRGVKTDNLVQIAHNVTVGEDTVLVAQVGISGSVTIGRHAILAGQAGIAGHLTLGDDVIIGPQAGVAKSVPEGKIVSGSAAIPHNLWLRMQRVLPELPDIKKKVAKLEKRLKKLETEGR